jgi:hypothetical protein
MIFWREAGDGDQVLADGRLITVEDAHDRQVLHPHLGSLGEQTSAPGHRQRRPRSTTQDSLTKPE